MRGGGAFAEADALLLRATKHLETGLFKWKPNWEQAASDYEKAAKIYAQGGDTAKACDVWHMASHAHGKAGNDFFAARAMEALAIYLEGQARQDRGDGTSLMKKAIEAYSEASELYAMTGKFDKQAQSLTKAAQLLNPTSATVRSSAMASFGSGQCQQDITVQVSGMLCKAVQVLEEHEEEQKSYIVHLPDMYHSWMLTHLRSGDVRGAVAVMERLLGLGDTVHKKGLFERLGQSHNASKAALEVIVLCLSCSDVVWARQEMEKLRAVSGFSGSREGAVAASLLACFEDRNPEQLQEVLKDTTLQFISADISRMAKKLAICSTEALGAARPKQAPSSSSSSMLRQEQQRQDDPLECNPEEDIR